MKKSVFLAASILLVSATNTALADDLVINVEFEDVGDGVYCPSENNNTISISNPPTGKPDKKVEFRSNPAGNKFSLSFDPFSGKLYKSDDDGVIKNANLKLNKNSVPTKAESDPNQTHFQFKYSIYAADCPTIDPIIIIDR
jgi:hypothetical protein